jgi:branched-chain amino acid transport system substrate-binding protein
VARRCSSVRGRSAVAVCLGALALAGCSTDDSTVEGPVTVYVSLPLTGPFAPEGRDAADGARLALEQSGGRAGNLEVRATYLDDAHGKAWDPAAVGANARAAAQDSSSAAYIGELSSEPTRASLPITNEAGIPQISPAAGAIDLTQPADGYPGSPDRYRPSGDQTFARVVPSDEALPRGAVQRLGEIGIERVWLQAGFDEPWVQLMADRFREEARAHGLQLAEPAKNRIQPGEAWVSIPGDGEFGGDRAIPLIDVELSDGSFSVLPVQDPEVLPQPGREFTAAFRERFGRPPEPEAAYGYEAMQTVLAAIEARDEDADSFRAGVGAALLELERPDSVLGPYAFTDDGDSTLCRIQVVAVGSLEPSELCVRE